MSKRSADGRLLVPKKPTPTEGVRYLHRELMLSQKSDFLVEMDESDMCLWTVRLPLPLVQAHDARLGTQLVTWAKMARMDPAIVLSIRFPVAYPNAVPFVRIVQPRFVFHTGHVTIGGSICTPLLTPSKWKPMNVESLVHAILIIWKDGDAAIQMKPDIHCATPFVPYSEGEAKEAYDRVARHHGWIK